MIMAACMGWAGESNTEAAVVVEETTPWRLLFWGSWKTAEPTGARGRRQWIHGFME